MYLIIVIPGGFKIKLQLGLILFDRYSNNEMVEKFEKKIEGGGKNEK